MRLDFNVLWVEDQPVHVQSYKTNIENRLRKHGFKLCVQFASTVEEAKRFLSEDIYGDHVDLILMDFNLGAEIQGDEGLQVVREIFPYKDIVFYSAASADLQALVANRGVQGVWVSARETLVETVEGVFESLVHKVLDIDHSRGIVMGATSDIDQLINQAIVKLFDEGEKPQQDQTIRELKRHLKEKRRKFDKSMATLEALASLEELEGHHATYTSDDRLRLLRKMLKFTNLHLDHADEFERYQSSVPQQRNDLAHISVQKIGFSRKVYYRNGSEITSDDMRRLRVSLLDFHDLLDRLFGSQDAEAEDQ